jgi:hypothetical protein
LRKESLQELNSLPQKTVKTESGFLMNDSITTQSINYKIANAYEMEEAIAVKRAVAKSSRIYTNSSWDLVDAVEKDAVKLSDIDDSALPKELQGKSETKIKEYVAEKSAERKKIQTEINALNAKRDQYIAEHQKEERGELENAMLKAIEKQAARKNYAWE